MWQSDICQPLNYFINVWRIDYAIAFRRTERAIITIEREREREREREKGKADLYKKIILSNRHRDAFFLAGRRRNDEKGKIY